MSAHSSPLCPVASIPMYFVICTGVGALSGLYNTAKCLVNKWIAQQKRSEVVCYLKHMSYTAWIYELILRTQAIT